MIFHMLYENKTLKEVMESEFHIEVQLCASLYLAYCIRQDISFVVDLLVKIQHHVYTQPLNLY